MTRERRFLVPEVARRAEVEIAGAEAHHLLQVLRLGPGEEIVLFDGAGFQWRARITRCDEKAAWAERGQPIPSSESPLQLRLALAIPRPEKLALVVQKATELGANLIVPVVTSRSAAAPGAIRLERLRRVAVEACKQAGRCALPRIVEPVDFRALLEWEEPGARLLVAPGGGRLPEPPPLSCLAVVGPEGGWTPEERAAALERGFVPWGLGPRTLRVETAAIVAAALLQNAWGDGRGAAD